MEKLEKKYEQYVKALETLQVALTTYDQERKTLTSPEDHRIIIVNMLRDSVIKRFEYCCELSWKYLALYLDQKCNLTLEQVSPNYVLRKTCQAGLLSQDDMEQALTMVHDRNQTSHRYKEEIADFLATHTIPNHYKLMHEKLLNLKP